MKLEHFALNVSKPVAMAKWYNQHLGLKTVRAMTEAPYTHFLADDSDKIMIEIYNNPPEKVPPYKEMDPLLVHIAFVTKDPEMDKVALLAAGATYVEEKQFDDGTHLIMLRDPWGLAIQLCKRGVSMIN